jgi:ribonuclease HI
MKKVHLITDGSCLGNPGRGGWAAILRYNSHTKEMFGSEPDTTNNRMELTAPLRALAALKESCEVEITTDSQYLKNGIETWIANWKRNGWKTASKKPVQNQDLWVELDQQVQRHRVTWAWTKGHADHEDNNRCDELARLAAEQQVHSR